MTRFDLERLGKLPSAMMEAEFVAAFGGIYEHSPWVARQTFRDGAGEHLDSVEGLAAALAAAVDAADQAARLTLIRAHPDLAGRAAVRGELEEASTREQAGAGIDQCTPEEYQRFQSLNQAYRDKFGFPFVMAVKGSDRHAILAAFAERLGNDPAAEFERAIGEIHRIARFRLDDLRAG